MKIAILLICIFTLTVNVHAQSDSIYKPLESQTYSPVLAGAFSYIFPGLGQMYCGESDRGLKFIGYYGLSIGVTFTGAFIGIYQSTRYGGDFGIVPSIMMGSGLIATMGIYGYSIVDAVQIAVRKNRSVRQNRPQISFNYKPVQVVNGYANSLSCSIRF